VRFVDGSVQLDLPMERLRECVPSSLLRHSNRSFSLSPLTDSSTSTTSLSASAIPVRGTNAAILVLTCWLVCSDVVPFIFRAIAAKVCNQLPRGILPSRLWGFTGCGSRSASIALPGCRAARDSVPRNSLHFLLACSLICLCVSPQGFKLFGGKLLPMFGLSRVLELVTNLTSQQYQVSHALHRCLRTCRCFPLG
jgi:hypothetical protein